MFSVLCLGSWVALISAVGLCGWVSCGVLVIGLGQVDFYLSYFLSGIVESRLEREPHLEA